MKEQPFCIISNTHQNLEILDKVSEYIKTHDKGAETDDELVRELSGVNITMAIVIKCIDHHDPSFRSSQTSLLFTDLKLF